MPRQFAFNRSIDELAGFYYRNPCVVRLKLTPKWLPATKPSPVLNYEKQFSPQ